jgi:hypothetical protein
MHIKFSSLVIDQTHHIYTLSGKLICAFSDALVIHMYNENGFRLRQVSAEKWGRTKTFKHFSENVKINEYIVNK